MSNNILSRLIQSLQITQPTLATGITANAGGGQTSATNLGSSINVIATVGTTGDSVQLPTILAQNVPIKVVNNGANACNIFPPTGGNLGAGVNTAYSLAAGHTAEFLTSGTGNTTSNYTRVITFATT